MKKFDGAKVTKFRVERGWTKTHLGELVGLSQQSITDIEYNRNKSQLNRDFQNKLSEVFGVPVSEFYSEESEIKYNYKPSGSRAKSNSPFRKIEFGIEQFLEASKGYDEIVEVEYIGFEKSRMDAWEFLDLYGDRKIRLIKTEIAKEVTTTYREDELIDKDETINSVIVLYVKSRKDKIDEQEF
ncbi:TPA: helix-turn-helix transcriptional regulator [Streptococcus suis]